MGYGKFTTNTEYNDNIKQWDITKDCLDDSIKRKGTEYLANNALPERAVIGNPANAALNEYILNTYNTRVLPMAVFFNFTASTVASWVGTVMRKPATVEFAPDGQDSIIDYLRVNANGAGDGIDQQSKRALESSFAYSGGLFLVSPPDKAMSPVSIREGSIAPRINVIDRRKILDWAYQYIDSEKKLSYLKVIDGKLRVDGVDEKEETLLIEYWLDESGVTYSITAESGDDEGKVLIDKADLMKAGSKSKRIPAFPFGAQDNDLTVDSAPLTVIANKNIEHYQMSSRHQQQCYDAGQGQYHIDLGDTTSQVNQVDASGNPISPLEFLNPGGLKLGCLVPIVTANGGSVNLVQITTDNLLAQEPDRLERQAQKLGAIMMTEQNDATATASRIAASGMTAQLSTAADNVSRAMTSAIKECGDYASYEYDGIKYELSRDLVDVAYSPQDKAEDRNNFEAGLFPREEYYNKQVRMGEVSASLSYKDWWKALEDERADRELGGTLPSFGNTQEVIVE